MAARIADPKDVRDLYSAGFSTAEVAQFLGVNQSSIVRSLKRQGIAARPKHVTNQPKGKDSPFYRGETASYSGMHKRVYRHRGKPTHCSRCGSNERWRYYEWACLGDYNNPEDYASMCKPCHSAVDAELRDSRGYPAIAHYFGEAV